MDSTFRANEVFIPVVFLEAGASETLVCSRAKRAQSEPEALIAPRRVEGSQRNFLDSLPIPYSVNHLTEKTRLCSRKNKIKENEPNVIDPEGIRHGMRAVAGWVGGKKKRWGRRQRMCVRGVRNEGTVGGTVRYLPRSATRWSAKHKETEWLARDLFETGAKLHW